MLSKKNNQIFSATELAQSELKRLLEKRGQPCAGIRISVKTRGCTGRSYVMSFVDKIDPLDQKCVFQNIAVFIDPKAFMFLVGTVLDYEKKHTAEGFVFINPNEKGRCGCGESFYT